MPFKKDPLGLILVRRGYLTEEDLFRVQSAQAIFGGRLGTNAVNMNLVSLDQLSVCLAFQKGVHEATRESFRDIPQDVLNRVPPEFATRYKICPLRLVDKVLHLAMRDPDKLTIIDEVAFALGYAVQPYAVPELRLAYYLEMYYRIPRDRHLQAYNDEATAPPPLPGEGIPADRRRPGTATGWPSITASRFPMTPTPAAEPLPPCAGGSDEEDQIITLDHYRVPEEITEPGEIQEKGAAAPLLEELETPASARVPSDKPWWEESPPAWQEEPQTQQPDSRRQADGRLGPTHSFVEAPPRTPGRDARQGPSQTGPFMVFPNPPREYYEPHTREPRARSSRVITRPHPQVPPADRPPQAPPAPLMPERWDDDPDLTDGELEFLLGDEEDLEGGGQTPTRQPPARDAAEDTPVPGRRPYEGAALPDEVAARWTRGDLEDGLLQGWDRPEDQEAPEDDDEEVVDHEQLASEAMAAIREKLQPLLHSLELAERSEDVIRLLVEPFLPQASLIVGFLVRKGKLQGRCADGTDAGEESVRAMAFNLDDSPLLKRAVENRTVVCDGVEDDPLLARMAAHLGQEAPSEALVAPVLLNERVVNLVCVHASPGKHFDALARALYRRLTQQAALTYVRLIQQRKG